MKLLANPMADKREEVARALDMVPTVRTTPNFLLKEMFSDGLWKELRIALAQAAIEAYRMPTDAMMEAALDEYGKTPDMPDEEIERICRAMADAALEGK